MVPQSGSATSTETSSLDLKVSDSGNPDDMLGTARSVSLESSKRYRDLSRRMRDPANGVERKDRKRGPLRTYKNCFVASEFVDWLVNEKEVASRAEAMQLGDDMLLAKVLVAVNDDDGFKDSGAFYRFAADAEAVASKESISYTLPQEEGEHQEYLEAYYAPRGRHAGPLWACVTYLLATRNLHRARNG